MKLVQAAEIYERETGFRPQNYLAAIVARAGQQGRANALLSDLEWYRRHSQDTHRRVRIAINKAI
jgi:hypothetical protein